MTPMPTKRYRAKLLLLVSSYALLVTVVMVLTRGLKLDEEAWKVALLYAYEAAMMLLAIGSGVYLYVTRPSRT